MALADRFRRKSQPASAGTQPPQQYQYQVQPQPQPIQGPFGPAPQPVQQAQPQPQPPCQAPPVGYMYDNYGRLIPDPRYALPQQPQPQPLPQQQPVMMYDVPMQRAANGKPAMNDGKGKTSAIIPPMVVMTFMAGGVIGCAYFSFLMKPFVSTTVIKWMPALLGLLFLMNGIGLFGLYLKK